MPATFLLQNRQPHSCPPRATGPPRAAPHGRSPAAIAQEPLTPCGSWPFSSVTHTHTRSCTNKATEVTSALSRGPTGESIPLGFPLVTTRRDAVKLDPKHGQKARVSGFVLQVSMPLNTEPDVTQKGRCSTSLARGCQANPCTRAHTSMFYKQARVWTWPCRSGERRGCATQRLDFVAPVSVLTHLRHVPGNRLELEC